jgi:hypothetical protein
MPDPEILSGVPTAPQVVADRGITRTAETEEINASKNLL